MKNKSYFFILLFCLLGLLVKFDLVFAKTNGFKLGSYKGVIAYSNGDTHGVNGPYKNYGYQFQCVEYVNRFYAQALKWKNMRGSGNGVDYFGKAKSNGLEANSNNSSISPQPDDLLTFSGGGYGHVAIITEVGDDYINIIEQNWSSNSATRKLNLTISNGKYYISPSGGYQVQGWLRIPGYEPDLEEITEKTQEDKREETNNSNDSNNSNTSNTTLFSLNHIGWLDAHSNNSKATHLSSGNFGGSAQGVHLATNSPDQDIYFYGEWNGNQIHQGQASNQLSRIEGKGRKIQDMVSGKFGGGHKEYLAVIYQGSDLVYFYYNNSLVGAVDTHGGRPEVNQITTGDVDNDGRDELFVSTTTDDHIYMFDSWRAGGIGFTMNKIEHNFLDAHGGNPEISALACMDIDNNGHNELMVATTEDDHVYEYFYSNKKNWRGQIEEVNFHKQGYVDGASGGFVKEMATGGFRGNDGVRDYLAVLVSGNQNKVYFYWDRDLGKAYGGLLSKSGFIKSSDGKNLSDIAASDINPRSEGEELILATESNDHVNFYGDIIGGKGGSDEDFYNTEIISQSDETIMLRPDQEKKLWIEYKNTGSATWFEGKNNTLNLITTKPHKRNSIFSIKNWPNQWQPTLLPREVKPGGKIKYKFKIKAPSYSDKYMEVFALYNGENNDLYKNSQVKFEINVDGEAPTTVKHLKGDKSKTSWQKNITRDPTPSFKWLAAHDAHSGIEGYYASIDDVTPDGRGRMDKFIGNKLNWTVPEKLSEGWHTMAVTSKDKLGNVNPSNTNKLGDAPYLKFLIDRTPPSQVKNFQADESYSNWISTGIKSLNSGSFVKSTNNSSPKFNWQKAKDNLSGVAGYYVSVDNDNPNSRGEFNYKISNKNSFVLPRDLEEGEHIIYIRPFDKAGNKNKNTISYKFIIDKSPPKGSIEINNGAKYTNNLDINLDIGASDLSPITEYRISSNAKNWHTFSVSNLMSLSSGNDWKLEEADGTRYVYIQFKDALGHISKTYYDTIYLDKTKPISFVNDLPMWHNNLNFLVSWHGDDNLSGVNWYDVQYKDSDNKTWIDWLKETTLTSKIFKGVDGITYSFRSRAQDLAKNQEEYPDEPDTEVTVDITAPDPPVILNPERNAIFNASLDENEDLEGVQVLFSGIAEAESSVELVNLSDNSKRYMARANLEGGWSIVDVDLVEGENEIEVEATDAAQNSNTSGIYKYYMDTIAPASISDLTVGEVNYHSLNLEWTAVGDDKNQGTASEYDIRYSKSEITANNFDSAVQAENSPLPEAAGTHQNFVLNNLEPKETYYVAIRTSDEVSNWSHVSNIVSEYTPTSANTITLTASRNTVMAEGRQTINLEARVLDHEGENGPKLSGEPVAITITDNNSVEGETGNISDVVDHGNGVYTAVYTSATKIGDGQIEITSENLDCTTITQASININLIPGNPADLIKLIAEPSSLEANGSSVSTITSGIIKDRTGNTVANGQEITVSADLGTIITPDRNAAKPGVQVLTQDGRIEFQLKSSNWDGYDQVQTQVSVSAQSVQGSASGNTNIIFKDVTAPNAPHIESPSDGLITNNSQPTISGRAERKSRVLIYKRKSGGTWRYQYYIDANDSGRFSYTFGSELADGNWSFRVVSVDEAENRSKPSRAISVQIDTQGPKITGFGPTGIIHHTNNTIWANYKDVGSGIDVDRIILRVDGMARPATVTADRVEYSISGGGPGLSPGEAAIAPGGGNHTYNVELEAYDRASNRTLQNWTFKVQVASFFQSKIDATYKTSVIADWPYTSGRIPEPNWWDSGFDDSSWSDAVYQADLEPNSVPRPCSGCRWLWGDAHVDPNETTIFRKKFNIPSGVTITDAAIRMSADNEAWGYVGYVNGRYFGKVPEAGSDDNPHTFGLESFLRSGENLLAVQTSNGDDNRAGFAYTMTVRYHD